MKSAGVLLLILPSDKILFIKRSSNLPIHSGEVSFPGGKFESTLDNDILDTAKRETFEEIGLQYQDYKIIDSLPPHKTVTTNFIVNTFIARLISEKCDFTINHSEVDELITIPISHLRDRKNFVKVPLKIGGDFYYNTFYYYSKYLIWGATSRILDDFFKKYD